MAHKFGALVLACVVAPVVATTIGAIAFFGEFGPPGEYTLGLVGAAMVGAWLGAVVGIPTMLLIGLPLHAYFQSRGMTTLAPYAFGGALAGVLAALAFMLWPPAGSDFLSWPDFVSRWSNLVSSWETPAKVLFFGGLTGVLAASTFWGLSQLHRIVPNLDTSIS